MDFESYVNLAEANDKTPTEAQTDAYRDLKENELPVRDALLAGLSADYPRFRKVYQDSEPEYLPDIKQAADFCELKKPINMYINSESERKIRLRRL